MKNTTSDTAGAGGRSRWAWTAATFFGVGFLKPGPGTWGSFVASALWLAMAYSMPRSLLLPATAASALLALAVGIPAASVVERESGGADPQHVVLDEVAGQWIALLAACGGAHADWPHALICLALFRLFDIVKPPPARQLEALHEGFGIMLDDVAAGLYALGAALIAFHWYR